MIFVSIVMVAGAVDSRHEEVRKEERKREDT